jgi:hypothetical protein
MSPEVPQEVDRPGPACWVKWRGGGDITIGNARSQLRRRRAECVYKGRGGSVCGRPEGCKALKLAALKKDTAVRACAGGVAGVVAADINGRGGGLRCESKRGGGIGLMANNSKYVGFW